MDFFLFIGIVLAAASSGFIFGKLRAAKGVILTSEQIAELRVLKNLLERVSLGAKRQSIEKEAEVLVVKQPHHEIPLPESYSASLGEPFKYYKVEKDHVELAAPQTPSESSSFTPSSLRSLIREAICGQKIQILLQPIVSLPQRKIRHYECFSRLLTSGGGLVLPDSYLPIAEKDGLTSTIDNTMLFRCLQIIEKARHHQHMAKFFCNVSPHTLRDGAFLESLMDYIKIHKHLSRIMVMEFDTTDIDPSIFMKNEGLKALHREGCCFSLDKIQSPTLEGAYLASLGVRFVKVTAPTLLGWGEMATAFKNTLDSWGIDLIVTRVEEESMLRELLDFNVDYGQGYLFCPPRLFNQGFSDLDGVKGSSFT